MASLTDDPAYYAAIEAQKMRAQFGPDAEIPMPSRGKLIGQPPAAKIAALAQRATEAGQMLHEARLRYDEAARHKEKCHLAFVQASEELIRAMHEHREGTPEGVPYQS